MEEKRESPYCEIDGICDALRYLGDASYAILPKDVAHQIAELKTNLLGGIRSLIDKEIDWINARVAGGDHLREEWRRRTQTTDEKPAAGSGI